MPSVTGTVPEFQEFSQTPLPLCSSALLSYSHEIIFTLYVMLKTTGVCNLFVWRWKDSHANTHDLSGQLSLWCMHFDIEAYSLVENWSWSWPGWMIFANNFFYSEDYVSRVCDTEQWAFIQLHKNMGVSISFWENPPTVPLTRAYTVNILIIQKRLKQLLRIICKYCLTQVWFGCFYLRD